MAETKKALVVAYIQRHPNDGVTKIIKGIQREHKVRLSQSYVSAIRLGKRGDVPVNGSGAPAINPEKVAAAVDAAKSQPVISGDVMAVLDAVGAIKKAMGEKGLAALIETAKEIKNLADRVGGIDMLIKVGEKMIEVGVD